MTYVLCVLAYLLVGRVIWAVWPKESFLGDERVLFGLLILTFWPVAVLFAASFILLYALGGLIFHTPLGRWLDLYHPEEKR